MMKSEHNARSFLFFQHSRDKGLQGMVTAFYARRSPTPRFVPHRAATARRLGQASYSAPSQQQAVQFACCGTGYLRACVALKPSGGAGLSKGQRGARRNAPIAPWKTTPLVAVLYPAKLNGCTDFNIWQMNASRKMYLPC